MTKGAWLCRCLLGLWLLSGVAKADQELQSSLVDQLRQGQLSVEILDEKGVQDADKLFLLGWLYLEGGYGVTVNSELGRELIQRAAEQGQLEAMRYCWNRCLLLTTEVLEQLKQAVASNQPLALYLQAQLAKPVEADQLLLRSAKLGRLEAIEQLYTDHFVDWAAQVRSVEQAVSKLNRCVDEGVALCYYLLAALYQKHQDHQQALFYYRVFELVAPLRYAQLQSPALQQQLVDRLPQQRVEVIYSRAASYLSARAATGNDRIDRFQQCADRAGDRCVQRLANIDRRCLPPNGVVGEAESWRASPGYRRCAARF